MDNVEVTDNAAASRRGLVVDAARRAELKAASGGWASWTLDGHQLNDLELLADGTFAPLTGYMNATAVASVDASMRLPDGTLFPVPVTLEVPAAFAGDRTPGERIALRDPEGTLLAALTVASTFRVGGAASGGAADTGRSDDVACLAGEVEVVQPPNQYDFLDLRRTPAQTVEAARATSHARIVAVPTWEPLLRLDIGDLRHAVTQLGARILVLAEGGATPAGSLDRFALIRVLRAALAELPDAAWMLGLVPLDVRSEDPVRQALLEAIVARAHGATHLRAPDDPSAAQAVRQHVDELDLQLVERSSTVNQPLLSPAELRQRLADGDRIPDMVASPAVLEALRRAVPPRQERGFTVFFTGLSGSGKSTIANIVAARLRELGGGRKVTLLDGDLVRRHLSSELGFSREHRNVNVLRIGWVAGEVTRHGGIAVCAPIAPYDAIRRQNRQTIEATGGGYILVHVATPLEVCEARDRKGLYAKARAGEIPEFTGISDPYEVPADADVTIDTTDLTPTEAADLVLSHLSATNWVA